jgi:CRISPR-associated endonuclease/helicase Cas3
MCNDFYAHSLPGHPQDEWQPLEKHLRDVAGKAAQFASAFASERHGHLAGIWHDLGKYLCDFQERLKGRAIKVDHAAVGAALAMKRNRPNGFPVAFAIAGHHSGLPNLKTSGQDMPTPLDERVRRVQETLREALENAPIEVTGESLPDLPLFLQTGGGGSDPDAQVRCMEFWIRFLYSALVDADRLDAEAFDHPEQGLLRGNHEALLSLLERLDRHLEGIRAGLTAADRARPINQARQQVLAQCRAGAECPTGFFSLTVPTGGAKTLSGMAFALRHAMKNGLHGVIVVIPYTSIIEQNAGEYRKALGDANVIEHHTNLDPEKFKQRYGEEALEKHELAAENWDAPIIVTTTVQFFESLFSNKSSRCRKLHNIARSVVILDEVQTLPPGFLLSILDSLKELVAHYGCSVVLSTATPPALVARERFPEGISNVQPIVPEPARLYASLKRVDYSWPDPDSPPVEWPDLARQLAVHPQVLTVVHRRADARTLARELQTCRDGNPVFHLSALMCPAHRTKTLERIRAQLQAGAVCRAVSTQLVEAGVDVDFPVVYRALGGLDSIVQAAGRCNREQRNERGFVTVFRAPSAPPVGTPRKALAVMESLLRENATIETNDPAVFEEYFRRLYFLENKDTHAIQAQRQQLNFATVGVEFNLIEDGFTQAVVVPYGEAGERLAKLRSEPTKEHLRALQPFTVSIYEDTFTKWVRDGVLEEVTPGIHTLTQPYLHLYQETFGLEDGDEPRPDPKALMA